jgi:hypothetical protein
MYNKRLRKVTKNLCYYRLYLVYYIKAEVHFQVKHLNFKIFLKVAQGLEKVMAAILLRRLPLRRP